MGDGGCDWAAGVDRRGRHGCGGGCSTRVAYDSVQNRQRLECQKIQDLSARSKCLADASTPYDDYKRQTESAKTVK